PPSTTLFPYTTLFRSIQILATMSDPINDKLTSGRHHSFWIESQAPLKYKTLQNDITTDVLIIGGGIAGVTTAYCLAKSGRKVTRSEEHTSELQSRENL